MADASIALPTTDAGLGAVERTGVSSRAGWTMLGIVWLIYLGTCVDRLAWGNVALAVGESLHLQIGALGVFVSSFFVGYAISNVVIGALCDSIGPRRLLIVTLVPMGICTALFGTITSVWFGMAMQAGMGFAAGADLVAGLKIISIWIKREQRGLATGFFLTGTSLAVVVTNMTVPTVMASFGWSGVYYILGAITALSAILALLAVPELPRSLTPGAPGAASRPRLISDRRTAVQYSMIAAGGFAGFWGLWGFAFWANALMIKSAHIPPVRAGFIVATFGIGALFSKPLIGIASDILGSRRGLAIASFVGFTASLLIFGGLQSEFAFWIMAPILGAMAFAFSPMLYAITAETSGPERAGFACGIVNGVWQLGSLVVPLVVGYVFQETQSFYAAFLALSAGPIVAIICLLFVREGRTFRAAE